MAEEISWLTLSLVAIFAYKHITRDFMVKGTRNLASVTAHNQRLVQKQSNVMSENEAKNLRSLSEKLKKF